MRDGVPVQIDHASGEAPRGQWLQNDVEPETVTDERGLFQFSQIGPGVHRLDVRTSAHHAVSENIDVGTHSGEVELLLEPTSR